MNSLKADLINCDRELIHLPGFIQCHGFIIVIDNNLIIRYCSDNIVQFLPEITYQLPGTPFNKFVSFVTDNINLKIISGLIFDGKANEHFYNKNPFNILLQDIPFHVILSAADGNFMVEFEPSIPDDNVGVHDKIGNAVSEIFSAKKLNMLLQNAVTQVKNIIGYDRVMIYKFAEDGHGEVVAEARNETLESWYGLHYPASDIPKQARELYKLNFTRFIADVKTTPSGILTEANNLTPLNLTYTQLRAVSPIHIQYLKNMGVASSFSISLLYKGELWGLIACHNYTPLFIDFKSRASSKLIGKILSAALEFMEKEENNEMQELFESKQLQLNHYLLNTKSIENALIGGEVTMLDITNAKGVVLLYENKILKLGLTPTDVQLAGLVEWIGNHVTEVTFQTTNLASQYPSAIAFKEAACGILLFTISKELKEYAIWFKPEVLQTVSWAGNPDKPVLETKDGALHLSPRHSFEIWQQQVTGSSLPWTQEEIKSVTRLKEELLYAINIRNSAIKVMNEKLKKAYEELDTFSYTISHDLKNPISAIKGYTDIMLEKADINDDIRLLLTRVSTRITKMNYMVDEILDYTHLTRLEMEFKKIDIAAIINEIINDLDLKPGEQKIEITTGFLPELFGDKVMITQVFNNLINNAIKYSEQAGTALIHIEGTVTNSQICYSIKDNGMGIAPQDRQLVFGLFSRMVNAQKIPGSGVGLAIVKRIIEKHNGTIWVESELGKGSTFFLLFNKEIQGAD